MVTISTIVSTSVQSFVDYALWIVGFMIIYYVVKFFVAAEPPSKEELAAEETKNKEWWDNFFEKRKEKKKKEGSAAAEKKDYELRNNLMKGALSRLIDIEKYKGKKILKSLEKNDADGLKEALENANKVRKELISAYKFLRVTGKFTKERRTYIENIRAGVQVAIDKSEEIITYLRATSVKLDDIIEKVKKLREHCAELIENIQDFIDDNKIN
ncbi:hypothetical protein HYX13_03880 [Candidatus Woesearchaeota archaeon]|nr:hypothetical protein [Candidatus Woesearchaeota archaeon]